MNLQQKDKRALFGNFQDREYFCHFRAALYTNTHAPFISYFVSKKESTETGSKSNMLVLLPISSNCTQQDKVGTV